MTLHETAHPAHARGSTPPDLRDHGEILTGRRPVAGGVIGAIGDTPLIELAASAPLAHERVSSARRSSPTPGQREGPHRGIRAAEESGQLRPGALIVDITSETPGPWPRSRGGGYRTKFYLGDNTSPDKRLLLEAIGAEIVPVPNSLFLDPEALTSCSSARRRRTPGRSSSIS